MNEEAEQEGLKPAECSIVDWLDAHRQEMIDLLTIQMQLHEAGNHTARELAKQFAKKARDDRKRADRRFLG